MITLLMIVRTDCWPPIVANRLYICGLSYATQPALGLAVLKTYCILAPNTISAFLNRTDLFRFQLNNMSNGSSNDSIKSISVKLT